MRILLLLPVIAAISPGFGQQAGSGATDKAVPTPQPIAAPGDVDSIDHVVAAIYAVISGPAGEKRNWDRMRSLFPPNAMMAAVIQTRPGATRELEFNVERYIALSGPTMEKSGFFEREIGRRTEQFGHIAHVFSTYESRYHPEDKPFERGINSFQLYNDGNRWWIRTILWEGETPKLKLPGKYLRRG